MEKHGNNRKWNIGWNTSWKLNHVISYFHWKRFTTLLLQYAKLALMMVCAVSCCFSVHFVKFPLTTPIIFLCIRPLKLREPNTYVISWIISFHIYIVKMEISWSIDIFELFGLDSNDVPLKVLSIFPLHFTVRWSGGGHSNKTNWYFMTFSIGSSKFRQCTIKVWMTQR